MHRENRVLKDLVEKLHLELEEAVKREHRWKQKVVKLKARSETSGLGGQPPLPHHQQAYLAEHHHADMIGAGGCAVVAPGFMPPCYATADGYIDEGYPGGHAAGTQVAGYPVSEECWPQMSGYQVPLGASMPGSGTVLGAKSFHPSRREPGLADLLGAADGGPLNQGGLLSISSISAQNSAPPHPESLDMGVGVSCTDSARSTDSGMLPQRPTRRQVMKPDRVPSLDFSRLKPEQVEEADEEEDEEEEEMEDEYPDGMMDEEGLREEECDAESDAEEEGGVDWEALAPETSGLGRHMLDMNSYGYATGPGHADHNLATYGSDR
jgi:hypothetical protein